jgi:hypothetical protein
MSAYASVPFARLYILPVRPALQIYLALAVEYMQMYNSMQQSRSIVALASCGRSDYVALFVYQWKLLFAIISHNFYVIRFAVQRY